MYEEWDDTIRRGITFSSFDLLHAGHILMLAEARSKCDYLIVGLQTDPTIDRPEKNKPIQSVYERYVQLKGCRYVDEIIPYTTESEIIDILTSQHIYVRFLGEEYEGESFTGDNLDIQIVYTERQHMYSSSELRNRITYDFAMKQTNIKTAEVRK